MINSLIYFHIDQGNVYQMAENLLQKDYALAYKEASTALNQRVENEQKQLSNNRLSVLAKRRLKKSQVKQPGKQEIQITKDVIGLNG